MAMIQFLCYNEMLFTLQDIVVLLADADISIWQFKIKW